MRQSFLNQFARKGKHVPGFLLETGSSHGSCSRPVPGTTGSVHELYPSSWEGGPGMPGMTDLFQLHPVRPPRPSRLIDSAGPLALMGYYPGTRDGHIPGEVTTTGTVYSSVWSPLTYSTIWFIPPPAPFREQPASSAGPWFPRPRKPISPVQEDVHGDSARVSIPILPAPGKKSHGNNHALPFLRPGEPGVCKLLPVLRLPVQGPPRRPPEGTGGRRL